MASGKAKLRIRNFSRPLAGPGFGSGLSSWQNLPELSGRPNAAFNHFKKPDINKQQGVRSAAKHIF